jgi:integrase
MDSRYKLYRRGERFYAEEVGTAKRRSLKTKDREQAQQMLAALNSRSEIAGLNRSLAEIHLSHSDERTLGRTWTDVMDQFCSVGTFATQERKKRAFAAPCFDELRTKCVIATTSDDFGGILALGKISQANYLNQLQNFALKMGWITRSIAPPMAFKRERKQRERRGVTLEEHQLIIAGEGNLERRCYYEMLWHTGAAQTDCAIFRAENFDLDEGVLHYSRIKNGQHCGLGIGKAIRRLLVELPNEGALFPTVSDGDWRYRAAEFARRCRLVGVSGVSLHSYRYAFAERCFQSGLSERHAMAALGHGNTSIHRIYSRKAKAVCPSLDNPD